MHQNKDKPRPAGPFSRRLPPFRGTSQDIILVGLLTLGGIFLYLWGVGSYALWDPWEPKYAQAMREMMARHDFITPYHVGYVRWTKPIFIYWAMYIPVQILGNNELAVRLPSIAAAILGLLLVFYFLNRLRGRRTAMMAACILGTLPQYFYMARQAMPDMLLTLFLGAAMGFFALARFGKDYKRRHLILFYISVALAFLTKGPVALAITLGALLLFGMMSIDLQRSFTAKAVLNDIKIIFKRYHVAYGLLIFIVVGSPWYMAMLIEHGAVFIEKFFVDQNIVRFQEPIRGHHGIVTYYIKTLFHGMYPWAGMLPVGILFLFQGIKEHAELRQRWYYLSWFLAIFLIFSAAGTKQQHYLLPITPAVAVLIAIVWEQYFEENFPFWMPLVFLTSIAFTWLPIRDFLIEGNKYIFDNFTNRYSIEIVGVSVFLKIFFAAWAIAMLLALFRRRSWVVAALAVLIAYGNGIYFCHSVMPGHTQHRTVKQYVDYYRNQKDPQATLLFYGKWRPSIDYYHKGGTYTHFYRHQARELADFVKDKKKFYIIAEHRYVRQLRRRLKKQSLKLNIISRAHPRYDLISN